MKIAFPSHDQKNIFPHFGRTPGFQIVTVENGQITNQEFIPNSVTGHAKNSGQNPDHSHNNNSTPSHNHSHSGIMDVLHDCEVVIANGMGRRLYDDFATTDKKIFVTQETSIVKAIEMYLNNTLDHNSSTCCSF